MTQVATFAQLGRWRVTVVKLPSIDTSSTERPLTDADVHAIRAELFRSTPSSDTEEVRRKKISGELASALAADPWHTGAHELAIALTSDREKRLEQARALADHQPKDARAFIVLARHLGDAEQAEERLSALERAVFLAPEDPEALNGLAWEYAIRGEATRAVPLATKAVKLAPWDPNIMDTFAFAAARAGQCGDAQTLQVRAIELLHERTPQQVRDDFRMRLSRYQAGCAGMAVQQP